MDQMNSSQKKVMQYLSEARASENALVRVLQSQIAMTPRGSYRSALDKHLDETRGHAKKVADRLDALDGGSNPISAVVGFWEDLIGQALAFGKTPLDLLRGSGGEEKVLKNAKDACASEALEIATYTAIERLARTVGDDETADLAERILADEERMLARIMREIPKLTDAVIRADVKGQPSYDITSTGAGEAVKEASAATEAAVRKTAASAKRTARQARKVPGVAQVEGQVKGAVAGADDLAIARYDSLTADEITAKRPGSRRSTWPRSTPTSARTRTAQRSSAESPPCAATSRGRGMTSSPLPRCEPFSPRVTTSASRRSSPTSALTRTAPASARPLNAN